MDPFIQKLTYSKAKSLQVSLRQIPVAPHFKKAAVLSLLVKQKSEFFLLLTRRTQKLRHHKGQICFPGGIFEKTDKNLRDTALRETHEEVGIAADKIRIIHELYDVTTPTGFLIRPFLAYADGPLELKTSRYEIDEVLWVPLKDLTKKNNFKLKSQKYGEYLVDDPVYSYQENQIWGATGRIVYQLLQIVNNLE